MSQRPPSDAVEAALDRALSIARTPAVPADLAARIVAHVTELPQPAAGEKSIPQASDGRSGRKRMLAVALGAVVVSGAAALSGLWPAGNSPATDRPVLTASSGKFEEPDLAANSGDDLVRSKPETELHASVPNENAATEVAATFDRALESTPQIAAPSGESVMPIAPSGGATPQAEVELAEQAPIPGTEEDRSAIAVAAGPVGPASSNGNDANSGTTNSPVPGLPVPQSLGITGSSPAAPPPATKSGPAGRRPSPSRR